MQELELKKTKMVDDVTRVELSYEELIKICLNRVPTPEGIPDQGQQERKRIKLALADANGVLSLEDADATNLKAMVKVMPWPFAHNELATFCEEVREMKSKKK